MAMWTHYYDQPERWMEDDRIWRDGLNGGKVKTDPVTGERSVEYDPKLLRREGDCLISISENRLHLCISMEEVIRVPDGVRSIASGAFNKDSTPNLRHLIVPMSVDGIAREALIDCDGFEEFTYYNDRIYVCDDAFNPRNIKRMHFPPGKMTWNLEDIWRRQEVSQRNQQPQVVADEDDDQIDDIDLPF